MGCRLAYTEPSDQEALANVVKHSGATQARLLIEGDGDYYVATVEDNGKGGHGFFAIANRTGGFDEHPQLRDHFGLSIMRERARKIGGRVEVANLLTLLLGCPRFLESLVFNRRDAPSQGVRQVAAPIKPPVRA